MKIGELWPHVSPWETICLLLLFPLPAWPLSGLEMVAPTPRSPAPVQRVGVRVGARGDPGAAPPGIGGRSPQEPLHFLDEAILVILGQWLSTEAILYPREHLAMSSDVFGCHNWGMLLASSGQGRGCC